MSLKKIFTLLEVGLFQLLEKISTAISVENLLKRKINSNKKDTFSAWILANRYVDESRYVEAKKVLDSIFDEGKNNKDFIFLQSRVCYHLNEYNNIITLLSNNNLLNDSDEENFYLGMGYLEEKNYKLAIEYLSKYVIYFKPKEFMPYLKLGLAYLRTDDFENAKANYEIAKTLGGPTKQIDELISEVSVKK